MSSPALPFLKMNGLGNEIVVIDLRGGKRVLTPAEAAAIAAAPRSHFDQLMALHDPKSPGTEAFIRIYNADGSDSAACGNGTRCVALVLSEKTGKHQLTLETAAGKLACSVESAERITVDMGRPRITWQEIPLSEPFNDTRRIELQVGPIDKPLIDTPSVINVGNPHCIFWVERLDVVDLGKIGPMLEHHRLFPERANISLAHIISLGEIALKVWERGAGLTKACGSAACAAAVAAARLGRTERKVKVVLPGGALAIEWTAADRILMTGPAELEYAGEIPAGVLT